MSTTKVEKLVTAEELAHLAIDGPSELVEGRVVRTTPAGMSHGLIAGRVHRLLNAFLTSRDLGAVLSADTGFRVKRTPDTVRAPDVSFVSKKTIERGKAAGETFFPCAPDLAVEVLSPDDSMVMVKDKVHEYLGAGGMLVWVVNPRRSEVYVYSVSSSPRELSTKDEIDGGEALPGFTAKVAAFFE